MKTAGAARWKTFAEMRKDFPAVDMPKVDSRKPVVIFNIADNHCCDHNAPPHASEFMRCSVNRLHFNLAFDAEPPG